MIAKPLDRVERAKLTRKKKELEEQRRKIARLEKTLSGVKGDALDPVKRQIEELRSAVDRLDAEIGEALGSVPAYVLEARRSAKREARRASVGVDLSASPVEVEERIAAEKERRRRRSR